ncbi:MAG: helix-turn-helix domain-containing protein [Polyangiaceae bacterium]
MTVTRSPRKLPKQARSRALVDALLDATEALAFQSGLANVTVPAIVQRSGVGQGSVFEYFPSKEALVAAWAERTWQRALNAAVSAAATGLEGINLRAVSALNGVLWPYARATSGMHFGDVLGRRDVRKEVFDAVAAFVEGALEHHAAALPAPLANRAASARLLASVLASDLYLEWLASIDDVAIANEEATALIRRYLRGD